MVDGFRRPFSITPIVVLLMAVTCRGISLMFTLMKSVSVVKRYDDVTCYCEMKLSFEAFIYCI